MGMDVGDFVVSALEDVRRVVHWLDTDPLRALPSVGEVLHALPPLRNSRARRYEIVLTHREIPWDVLGNAYWVSVKIVGELERQGKALRPVTAMALVCVKKGGEHACPPESDAEYQRATPDRPISRKRYVAELLRYAKCFAYQ